MTDYLNYLYIILGLILIGVMKAFLNKKEAKSIDGVYSKKQYLITQAEREFFEVLQRAVGERYYIFPQVNLDKFLLTSGKERYGNFHRINQKSIDYLLCDKNYLSPILAIELNDSSHNKPNRIERDQQVEIICQNAHMPLLTIPWQSSYEPETIHLQINEKINPIPR